MRGATTFTYVGEHCNLFSVEDFVWWMISTNHGEKNKDNSMNGWWCGACRMSCDGRSRTLVTNLVRSNTFGENIKDPTEGSREKLAETSANFISVDSVVASVTMGELGEV